MRKKNYTKGSQKSKKKFNDIQKLFQVEFVKIVILSKGIVIKLLDIVQYLELHDE